MKSLISFMLIALYGLAMVKPALPLIDYYIKLDEYKAKCVNKARPSLHCNGKCILMQKLSAFNADMNEPTAPAPAKINFEDYPIGLVVSSQLSQYTPIPQISLVGSMECSTPRSQYIDEIFHPPSLKI